MAQYSIGEVEQLTGIRPYVLRYWEEVIPCFSPRKDINGRRIYSARDIDTINRLKYLIYTKRYTIDGARTQIIQESAVAETQISAVQALHEIRGELGDLYLNIQKNKEKRVQISQAAERAVQKANLINVEKTPVLDENGMPLNESEEIDSAEATASTESSKATENNELTDVSETTETIESIEAKSEPVLGEISQDSEIQEEPDYNSINEDYSAPLYL